MSYKSDKQKEKEHIEYIRSTIDPTYKLSKSEALKYAAKMGASDSFRGIQQFGANLLGMDEATEKLKRKDRTLQKILRSEEHTSELQSPCNLVCRLLLEKKKIKKKKKKKERIRMFL